MWQKEVKGRSSWKTVWR